MARCDGVLLWCKAGGLVRAEWGLDWVLRGISKLCLRGDLLWLRTTIILLLLILGLIRVAGCTEIRKTGVCSCRIAYEGVVGRTGVHRGRGRGGDTLDYVNYMVKTRQTPSSPALTTTEPCSPSEALRTGP